MIIGRIMVFRIDKVYMRREWVAELPITRRVRGSEKPKCWKNYLYGIKTSSIKI